MFQYRILWSTSFKFIVWFYKPHLNYESKTFPLLGEISATEPFSKY